MDELRQTSSGDAPLLEYGRAEPIGRRVSRAVPRISWTAAAAAVLLAGAISWLVKDHAAWAPVGSFARDPRADAGDVLSRSLSADGERLAVPQGDRAIVYEVRSGRQVSATTPAGARLRTVLLSPDGRRLVTEPRDYTSRLIDAGTGAEIQNVSQGPRAGAEFTPDSARVLFWSAGRPGGSGGSATMYDASDGRHLWGRGAPVGIGIAPIEEAAITADGGHAVIRHWSSPHTAVRVEDGREVGVDQFYPGDMPDRLTRRRQPGVRGGPTPSAVTAGGAVRLHSFTVASPDGARRVEYGVGRGYVRADVYDVARPRWLGHAVLPEFPLDARLRDDGSLFVVGYHGVQVYRARRPATWWGCAWLPAFWAAVVTGAAAVGFVGRDLRRWYRPVAADRLVSGRATGTIAAA